MIKAILFDFDGTLMDTSDLIIQSWQHTFRTLEGREHDEDEIRKTLGEVFETTMRRYFPNRSFIECRDIYRSYQKNLSPGTIKPFPGITELLSSLKSRGIKMAIVTSRTKSSLLTILASNSLTHYFDILVTCDDINIFKPLPEPALMAARELGVDPSECMMAGDSSYDIGCAKNAGIISVLASWCTSLNQKEIDNISPDYIISKPEELLDLC